MDDATLKRFLSKIRYAEDGCWIWTDAVWKNGYAGLRIGDKHPRAHRLSYEHFIGPIPDGHQVDHRCHDPATCKDGDACLHRRCVNPAHLEAVTPRVNTLRSGGVAAINAARTECVHGHPLEGANLYVQPDGKRQCRTCGRAKQKRHYDRQRTKQASGRKAA